MLEGRDIGTVVLPAAEVKIYLIASTAVRAERRMKEMQSQGNGMPLEEVERRYILRVWEAAGGNKSLAAQRLGVNRKTLYRKLKSYGVEV